jgi:hypothetical protein
MVTQKLQGKFSCDLCDYNTSRKSSYDKHLLSSKHNLVTNGDAKVAKSCDQYVCIYCSKTYISRNGLWKHNKTCNNTNDIQSLTKMVLEVVKQNAQLSLQICALSKEKTVNMMRGNDWAWTNQIIGIWCKTKEDEIAFYNEHDPIIFFKKINDDVWTWEDFELRKINSL